MSINEYVGKFIQNQDLSSKKVKILLAVSGGLDSMVMLNVMNNHNAEIGVATINYKLREHADTEAQVVLGFCKNKNIDHHLYIVSKEERESLKSSNLQQKARDIRYVYFQKIMQENRYSHLMTAHHSDDIIEGFFLSLKRSSGLNGLSGMKEISGNHLRPFLTFSKKDLRIYADLHQVASEEDESNALNTYDRNFIRNEIIPKLEARFPTFKKSILSSIFHIADANQLLNHLINKEKDHYYQKNYQGCLINNIDKMIETAGAKTLLFQMVKDYGFNPAQTGEMLDFHQNSPLWVSMDYEATIHNKQLIIKRIDLRSFNEIIIKEPQNVVLPNGDILSLEVVKRPKHEKSKNIEYIDIDSISFPLTLRQWQPGERIVPIGMNGQSKKIKDILTDAKMNRLEKKKCLVLCSGKKIIWLVNFRLDERFKVKGSSNSFLQLKYFSKKSNYSSDITFG